MLIDHCSATVAVWVVYELAARPEYIAALREEMLTFTSGESAEESKGFSFEMLRNAPAIDSFIREVMRTKGDVLSPVRYTTQDVNLGGYIVPKGT